MDIGKAFVDLAKSMIKMCDAIKIDYVKKQKFEDAGIYRDLEKAFKKFLVDIEEKNHPINSEK